MSKHARFNLISTVATASVAALATRAIAEAPAAPDRAWSIPQSAIDRAAQLSDGDPLARKGLDLPALIDLAERTNPETRVAWEAAREAAAAEGLVESSYLPQLTLQALSGFQHTPLPAPKNLVPAGYFVSNTAEIVPMLAVKWLLFDFGRRDAQMQGAKADSFVANVAFTGAHEKLVFAVSQAYFDLGASQGRLRAAQQAVKTAKTTEDAALAKRDRGLATVVAVAQAQRQTAQARYRLAATEGALRISRANLVAVLGIPAGSDLEVVDSAGLALPSAPSAAISDAIKQALSHRPDILAAVGKLDSAEASLKAERRSYYPTIEVSGQAFQNIGALSSDGKSYSTIDKTGGSIFLAFSMPLFDGGLRANRVRIAEAKVKQTEEQLEQARDTAAQQVVRAYNELTTSLAEFDAAVALGRAAHSAYDAALRSYQEGVGTYTDLSAEESAVVQAETQIEDARASSHTAAAALAFAVGSEGGTGSVAP
jgi:outer membrane protein